MPLVRKRKKQHSLAHLYYLSSPTLDTVAALRLRFRLRKNKMKMNIEIKNKKSVTFIKRDIEMKNKKEPR